jgi:hypothetical protein
LIALSFRTTTAAVTRWLNHLWSPGTMYHGAHGVLVADSMSVKAR